MDTQKNLWPRILLSRMPLCAVQTRLSTRLSLGCASLHAYWNKGLIISESILRAKNAAVENRFTASIFHRRASPKSSLEIPRLSFAERQEWVRSAMALDNAELTAEENALPDARMEDFRRQPDARIPLSYLTPPPAS